MAPPELASDPAMAATAAAAARPQSPRAAAWRRLRSHRLAMVSLVFLLALVVVAILAPLVATHAYDGAGDLPYLTPGDQGHLLGTDSLGRDLWSRIVYGARISLAVGVFSQLIALAIGLVVGGIAGVRGGWVDALLMRLTDIMQALPALLMALLFLAVFGDATAVLVLAIGIGTWPPIGRVVRAQVMQLRGREFVEAAYAVGCSPARVMLRHILPNITGPVVVQVTFGISLAVFAEAFLAFIGLGPPPPNPSWGRLVADGFKDIGFAPYLVLYPTLALSLTLLAINFVGDGLRDAFDPQERR